MEVAIHSVRSHFVLRDCDAVLVVDASNAFNSLNRIVALHSIRQLFPPFATLLINTYCSPACLFISSDVLMSEEGTTQSDTLAMPICMLLLQCAVDFASVKWDSSWLTALPLQGYEFALQKSAFQDALALYNGWSPLKASSLCACGSSFSVEHMLSCPNGGLPSLRHNDIRDLTASLLTEVCSQVIIEPELQPVSNPDEYSLSTSNT